MKLAHPAETDATLAADAKQLRSAMSELIRVYGFRDRDAICCYDVSVTQCNALGVLVERGPATLNELAAELYLEKSTASRVVDALEKKGYARRAEHPETRRSILIEVTPSGERLHRRIEHDLLAQEMRLLEEFEPEVRRSAARLIGTLASAAAARVDTRGGSCCSIG